MIVSISPLVTCGRQFAQRIDGEPTFASILVDYPENVAKGWSPKTQEQYAKDYSFIIPILPGYDTKPISEFTLGDFNDAMTTLAEGTTRRDSRHKYSESTLQHFAHLYSTVMAIAAENGLCEPVLWGSEISVTPTEEEIDAAKKSIKKYLSPAQEALAYFELTSDIENCPGEYMALLLMMGDGLRDCCAGALDFGDVLRTDEDQPSLLIYKSLISGTNKVKSSTKTINGNRKLPIPLNIYTVLTKRYKYICHYICDHPDELKSYDPSVDIRNENDVRDYVMSLPVCCQGNNVFLRTTVNNISAAGKRLMHKVGFDEFQYWLAGKDADDEARLENTDMDAFSATAYVFRRNYCFHAYVCFAAACEVTGNLPSFLECLKYAMGHAIYEGYIGRPYMLDDRIWNRIAEALRNRPIVNPISKSPTLRINNNIFAYNGKGDEQYVITKCKPGERILVRLMVKEPNDPTEVTIKASTKGQMHIEKHSWAEAKLEYPYKASVLREYQQVYIREYEKVLAHKQQEIMQSESQKG